MPITAIFFNWKHGSPTFPPHRRYADCPWGCGLDAVRDTSPLSFAIREGYYVDPPPPPPHIALLLTTETQ
ncbi:MAG TPA: hypothetical protein VGQ06_05555 [Gemmatimonadales bacterium]|nr:hypothetical protein [Gemmatimonadales bacterium]